MKGKGIVKDKNFIKDIGLFVRNFLRSRENEDLTKYTAEEEFWNKEIENYIHWYRGELEMHYGTRSPLDDEKIVRHTEQLSAISTWFELHQKPKYLEDLRLSENAFSGMKVLDVGAGPMPSAETFENCELYCLDPLYPSYLRAGFPIHNYKRTTRFVCGYSEKIPVEEDYFDVVISVNAIDHVDNFRLTAQEIKRVLKKNGQLRLHAHYHPKTITEPLELNDQVMRDAFSWCKDFKKIYESTLKMGSEAEEGELYALWSNF